MRAIVTTRNGDVDVMKVETRPDPTPGKGEVLIRVKAAGLNFADILSAVRGHPARTFHPLATASGSVSELYRSSGSGALTPSRR